jgi:hypothetical protein
MEGLDKETEKLPEESRRATELVMLFIPVYDNLKYRDRKELKEWMSEFLDTKLPFKCSYRVCSYRENKLRIQMPKCYLSKFISEMTTLFNQKSLSFYLFHVSRFIAGSWRTYSVKERD